MEPIQILLFSVVTVLTGLLVFVGVQVVLVLREAKKTLTKVNQILEDAELVTNAVSKPIVGFADFVDGIRNMGNVVDFVIDKVGKRFTNHADSTRADSTKSIDSTTAAAPSAEEPRPQEEYGHITSMQERGRRFFHKDGKPLTS